MSIEQRKQIVKDFLEETYNRGNLKNTNNFVTPDFVYHARGEDIEGIESYNEWVSGDRDIFPDIRFTLVEMNIFHFQDNKIKEGWVVVDALTPALQLGDVKATLSEV